MPKRMNMMARFAGAVILALGFLAPGARIPVFQEDLVAEVGRAHAGDRLSVVTTTQDLASIAMEIGGDRVAVESLTKGYQDPHFVDAKPSYLLKLRKADLFIEVGRDLEVGWVPGLLQSARNKKILPGGPGFVDASEGVTVLEAGGRVGREQGDVHPLGNPHYWLDPENGLVIAANLRDAFARARPEESAYFAARYASFERRLRAKLAEWKAKAAEYGIAGAKAATYHRSWSYFAKAFGIEVIGFVEPRPGVPPPPRHIQELGARMKSEGARLLIVEPYFDPKLPQRIAASAGADMVILPPSVGAVPEAADYLSLFDVQLKLLHDAHHGGR
ncbi:MAG TPA: metal ABC transporter substrate-binding protein [Candidatus Eisenbacteria bacterium]|nr:metal ABC transporter substrate-binding protein [Candidatus Eisenbacteria bacterium]